MTKIKQESKIEIMFFSLRGFLIMEAIKINNILRINKQIIMIKGKKEKNMIRVVGMSLTSTKFCRKQSKMVASVIVPTVLTLEFKDNNVSRFVDEIILPKACNEFK